MNVVALLMTAFLASAVSLGSEAAYPHEPAQVGGDCPVAQADSEWRIRTLLTAPFFPELRTRFDFGTASPDEIQLLTNERDTQTCRALWQAVRTGGTLSPSDRVSFYRSGDRFFVPIDRESPDAPGAVLRLDGYSSVDVYDAEYRLVGRFGG